MRPADDPTRDYRQLVAEGYDRCAPAYSDARSRDSEAALAPIIDRLPAASCVLDLGCGAGVPVARTLSRLYDVIGADISASMLHLARVQAPEAALVRADMATVAFAADSFDAVVSFYAIFHLPREEHEPLLRRIHGWLRPGGLLLATLAMTDEPAYTEEFFGVEMYWSNYGLDAYPPMLKRAGFEVLAVSVLEHGYDDPAAKPERHPLVLAQKAGE